MTTLLPALMLSASIDGAAALRHASALAALGPHPWGSPRAGAAAAYVAAQFRDAGLDEVRLEPFESHGIQGANVVGVLRARGTEFIVVGAHHDTAPDAPGAYDDGGGVGILIEAARVLARQATRTRTLVFVSWDGEEAWSTGKTTTSGSRAYVQSLGAGARDLVAAVAIEMSGWKSGTPALHTIAYADPRSRGASVVSPAWLVRAAQDGARDANAPFVLGDPWLSWLYQAAVRTFRISLYGDDLSFLQSGLPAIFVSDSSFWSFYPWYHKPADTADKLDAGALARMGQAVLGAVSAIDRTNERGGEQPNWFWAFGGVVLSPALFVLGVASLVPGLLRSLASGGLRFGARLAQAALFGVLLWRQPVPALWVLVVPNVFTALGTARWLTLVSLLPALALAGLGAAAWQRGFVRGVWLAPWELVVAALAMGLLWAVPPRLGAISKAPKARKAGRRGRSKS